MPALSVRSLGTAVVLALAGILGGPDAAGAAQEFPAFSNHVVDQAGVVPDGAERQVNATLADYQARSSNQVAVAVVGTTGGRPIEEYSMGLARSWGVGQQGANNGVLIVIAVEDRTVRIEVGLGLESVLTDQRAAAIINDGLAQRLSQGDMGGAVVFATDAVRRTLGDVTATAPVVGDAPRAVAAPGSPGFQPSPYEVPSGSFGPDGIRSPGSGFPSWIFVLLPIIGVLGVASSLGRSRRTGYRNDGPMFWGHDHRRGGSWSTTLGSGGHRGHSSGASSSGGFRGGGGGSFGGGGASGSW